MWNLWKGRACSVAKSCQTLWDHINHSPPGSSAHGISQARILEWVAMPSSRGSSWPRDPTCISRITGELFVTESPGKRSLKGNWFLKYGQICFWIRTSFQEFPGGPVVRNLCFHYVGPVFDPLSGKPKRKGKRKKEKKTFSSLVKDSGELRVGTHCSLCWEPLPCCTSGWQPIQPTYCVLCEGLTSLKNPLLSSQCPHGSLCPWWLPPPKVQAPPKLGYGLQVLVPQLLKRHLVPWRGSSVAVG